MNAFTGTHEDEHEEEDATGEEAVLADSGARKKRWKRVESARAKQGIAACGDSEISPSSVELEVR